MMSKQYFLSKGSVSFVGALVAISGLSLLIACGSGSSQNPPPPPTPAVIALPANRDSADSANLANNIWTIEADGSGAKELTSYQGDVNVTAEALQPIWSPDGSKIVYVSDGAFDGSNTLANYYYFWVMNADGSGKTPLSNVGPAAYTVVGNAADWSHDGTKLAVAAAPGNGIDTYIMNADGTNYRLLAGRAFGAVWSPNDTKLAYQGSDNNIWTVHADGSAPVQLTNISSGSCYAANAPVWSPDGTKLAFGMTNLCGPGYTIWTMNADGTNQISYPGSSFIYGWGNMIGRVVNWSPDGKKLAFYSTAALDGNPNSPDLSSVNIWVMNADGSSRTPLTHYDVNPGSYLFVPTWSSDGSKIAFLSGDALDGSGQPSSQWSIWTMNADGSALAPLTSTSTGNNWNTKWLQPAWKP
jgi:Tol biopolymer transport system component